MTSVTLHLDSVTEARLREIAAELGRSVEDLCRSAVSETALDYFRHQPSRDPAKAEKIEEYA